MAYTIEVERSKLAWNIEGLSVDISYFVRNNGAACGGILQHSWGHFIEGFMFRFVEANIFMVEFWALLIIGLRNIAHTSLTKMNKSF